MVCDQEHILAYLAKLYDNYHVMARIHRGLYLGATYLRKFRDPRLMVR